MKIGAFDRMMVPNAVQPAPAGAILRQQAEGKSAFQQLLQAEQLNAGHLDGNFKAAPEMMPLANGEEHGTEEAWLEAVLALLPAEAVQMAGIDQAADPREDEGEAAIIWKQWVADFSAAIERGEIQATNRTQLQELIALWQRHENVNLEAREEMLKWFPMLPNEQGLAEQGEAALSRGALRPIGPLPQSVSLPFYKLSAQAPSEPMTKLAETAVQKQRPIEAMRSLLPYAWTMTSGAFGTETASPMISLPEHRATSGNHELFVQQFAAVMKSSKFTKLGNGQSQLVIRLHPEHLGTLTVKLVQEKGEMMAKIIASSLSAKELVEANIQQLSHVIPAQQITVEQFDVLKHEAPHYEQPFGGHQGNREGRQQQSRQPLEREKELQFQEALTNELFNIEA